MRKKTITLHLARPSVSNFIDVLSESARDQVARGRVAQSSSDSFGDGAVLYVFPGRPKPPDWAGQLSPYFQVDANLRSVAPCAIIVFRSAGSIFVVTFSYAHVYLDLSKLEADFGLRVAVNILSDSKLKSVESANLGSAVRGIVQAAAQIDFHSFGFGDALDLVRKVSGKAPDKSFADNVTGARALRFTKEITLGDVPDHAVEAKRLFASTAYQSTAFKVLDFLSPVGDAATQETLDGLLVASIRDGTDEFEIAIPEMLPDHMGSYRFERAGFSEFHADLSLELYRDGLGSLLDDLGVDDLKNHSVAAHDEGDPRLSQSWSVYQALVGSIYHEGMRYALNEGLWFRVDDKFKSAADESFDQVHIDGDPLLRPFKKVAGAKSRGPTKVSYQSEESYNAEVARSGGYLLFDQRLIRIDSVPGPGFEACDLLDVRGRRLIHVKKSSRQSSVLSHLFKQGSNSAQLLRKYPGFADGMIDIARSHYGAQTSRSLAAALKDRWRVEFRIADFPRVDGKHNIPFFSKLTLQAEARNIRAMEFDVSVGFITHTKVRQRSQQ